MLAAAILGSRNVWQPLELVRRFFEATDRAFAGYWDNPRSIAEALESDDLDPAGEEAFSLLDPNVVWRAGDFGVYRGHMEMARAWDDLLEIAAATGSRSTSWSTAEMAVFSSWPTVS